MARFYFHLSNSDETIQDPVGSELPDLSAAHVRALQLAHRVIGFSCLDNRDPDWGRWRVQVTDEDQNQVVLTVLIGSCMLVDGPGAIRPPKGIVSPGVV